MESEDTFKMQAVIARFANSFDMKDWDGLASCFTESLYTDYGDMRGTPPETIRAADYVKSRRALFEGLNLHHLSGNYEIIYVDVLKPPAAPRC